MPDSIRNNKRKMNDHHTSAVIMIRRAKRRKGKAMTGDVIAAPTHACIILLSHHPCTSQIVNVILSPEQKG